MVIQLILHVHDAILVKNFLILRVNISSGERCCLNVGNVCCSARHLADLLAKEVVPFHSGGKWKIAGFDIISK